jgi:putative colanic acid biosynthesis glycosyltransferase
MSAAPRFSIVVPAFNAAGSIAAALGSLIAQEEASWECIVVDGMSTDRTPEVVGTFAERFAGRLVSVREPDSGIYDAMNKGIARASGDYLYFMGCDDALANPRVLGQVAAALEGAGEPDLAVCRARYDDGRLSRCSTRGLWLRNTIHHQGTFYRRETAFARWRYDTSFRVFADYDLNLQLLRGGLRAVTMPTLVVACCGSGGVSGRITWANLREECRVQGRHYPAIARLPLMASTALRYALRWMRACVSARRPA